MWFQTDWPACWTFWIMHWQWSVSKWETKFTKSKNFYWSFNLMNEREFLLFPLVDLSVFKFNPLVFHKAHFLDLCFFSPLAVVNNYLMNYYEIWHRTRSTMSYDDKNNHHEVRRLEQTLNSWMRHHNNSCWFWYKALVSGVLLCNLLWLDSYFLTYSSPTGTSCVKHVNNWSPDCNYRFFFSESVFLNQFFSAGVTGLQSQSSPTMNGRCHWHRHFNLYVWTHLLDWNIGQSKVYL